MLSRSPYVCIECGRAMSEDGFEFHYARRDQGPAYWSDRGVLCSARCAHRHTERRKDEGDPLRSPAANPLEFLPKP